MSNIVDKLIKVAKGEIGYCEKATNSQLDSKTANAGYNDWNKYARDLDKKYPNFLNGKKNGGEGYWWCSLWVVWCFIVSYGEKTAHKLLCQPERSLGASCTACMNYYKAAGRWHNRNETPKVGDQVIFQSNGKPCHTGIVVDVDSKYVYTVEGNTTADNTLNANGGCVAEKKYSRTSTYILGYGRPDFDEKPKSLPVLDKKGFKKNNSSKGVATLKQLLLIAYDLKLTTIKVGKGETLGSSAVKAINQILKKWGYRQNGIAGDNFISKLGNIIRKELK